MFIEGQLWNIKRCWFCLNSQEGFGLHKCSPSSYAGLLAFGKEGKQLRAWDWQLTTPAMPFKPPHVQVWCDQIHFDPDPNTNNVPTVLHLCCSIWRWFSVPPMQIYPYLHFCYFNASSHVVCGKLLYFCLSDVLCDHPVELFHCIFSILLNTLSLHWLNELHGLMHFQEQLSLWLPACVLVEWENPKTLQLKWLLKFMKINAEGDLFCTALTSLYEL